MRENAELSGPTSDRCNYKEQKCYCVCGDKDYSRPLSIVPSFIVPLYENSVYSHTSFQCRQCQFHSFKMCIVPKGWDYRQGLTV